jgi:ABC-type Fe3+-hydroxamate transport system substrate-binding protein
VDRTGIPIVPAQCIVSLAPSITEQLFAVGAGDKVVVVTLYDNYPPQVQQVERVGGYVTNTSPRLERRCSSPLVLDRRRRME